MTPKAAPRHARHPLKLLAWREINEPGAYVEVSTGALYRIPPQTLTEGAEPLIEKRGEPGSQPARAGSRPPAVSKFVQVSRNPFIFSLGARMICVEHDIRPAF